MAVLRTHSPRVIGSEHAGITSENQISLLIGKTLTPGVIADGMSPEPSSPVQSIGYGDVGHSGIRGSERREKNPSCAVGWKLHEKQKKNAPQGGLTFRRHRRPRLYRKPILIPSAFATNAIAAKFSNPHARPCIHTPHHFRTNIPGVRGQSPRRQIRRRRPYFGRAQKPHPLSQPRRPAA